MISLPAETPRPGRHRGCDARRGPAFGIEEISCLVMTEKEEFHTREGWCPPPTDLVSGVYLADTLHAPVAGWLRSFRRARAPARSAIP